VERARVFTIADLRSSPARDGMQTQMDLASASPRRGVEPMATMVRKTAAKIARRRMGRSPDGGYGGCVMG
jgi:hypothetical protein